MPDLPVTVVLVEQKCGTCEHPHKPGLPCGTCHCELFAPHRDDLERDEDLALRELIDYDRPTLLTPAEANILLDSLSGWEEQVHQFGQWDLPPMLATVVGHEVPAADGSRMLTLAVTPLQLPNYFWAQGSGNPLELLAGIIDRAQRNPGWFDHFRLATGLDKRDKVMAWVLYTEAYAKAHAGDNANADPLARLDEIRTVTAVDCDERMYSVQRFRHKGDVHRFLAPPREYRQATREGLTRQGLDPDKLLGESGMPRANELLRALIRITTAEALTADALERRA
jgi:hypothetical protein